MDGMRIKDIISNLKSDGGGLEYAPLMSGLEDVDEMVQGFKPGELCVIASRPAMGKTAMILTIARNLAKRDVPVALFTAIDTANPLFLSRIVNILSDNEVSNRPEDVKSVLDNDDMPDLPFYLYANNEMTMDDVRLKAKEMAEVNGVKCIFIETIQKLFVAGNDKVDAIEMERVCMDLKSLAVELNIPIIISSDINRGTAANDGYEGKRPVLSNLSLCGAIENVADSVWILQRPSYYGVIEDIDGSDISNLAIVIVRKNRLGSIGDVKIGLMKRNALLRNTNQLKKLDNISAWVCYRAYKCLSRNNDSGGCARS